MRIFLFLGFLLAQEVYALNWKELDLTVADIEGERGGEICVMVFQEDGFPKDHSKALKRYTFDAVDSEANLKIQVPEGIFALKIHHDEDRSGTMTKNWTGFIPAEGVGFSSGARVRFGPPSFKAAKMEYPESGSAMIPIRYP